MIIHFASSLLPMSRRRRRSSHSGRDSSSEGRCVVLLFLKLPQLSPFCKVLKDETLLGDYNLQNGNTVNMVARPENFRELQEAAAASTAAETTPQPPRSAPLRRMMLGVPPRTDPLNTLMFMVRRHHIPNSPLRLSHEVFY